jgi:L-proline amide hydrolase
MLALEHALNGTGELTSLILSSTLASSGEWVSEVTKLRDAMPPDVLAAFARADREGVWEGPEWDAADEAFSARHFYRGPLPRPEIERMKAGRSKEAYHALWGPNEWTATGPLRDWDVRDRLGEIDVPTLVIRGAYDECTEPIAATLVRGIRGARLVVFEESSHTPVLEETERYLRVVADFVAEAEAA